VSAADLVIKDAMSKKHEEARVVVNGFDLTAAESMTVRVALESLSSSLADEGALGHDEHGEVMRLGYLGNIRSIRRILYSDQS
jgi:hypothetical protein